MESKNKIFDFDEFIHRQVIAILGNNTSHEITESAQYKDIEQQQREEWKDLKFFAETIQRDPPLDADTLEKLSALSSEDVQKFVLIMATGETTPHAQLAAVMDIGIPELNLLSTETSRSEQEKHAHLYDLRNMHLSGAASREEYLKRVLHHRDDEVTRMYPTRLDVGADDEKATSSFRAMLAAEIYSASLPQPEHGYSSATVIDGPEGTSIDFEKFRAKDLTKKEHAVYDPISLLQEINYGLEALNAEEARIKELEHDHQSKVGNPFNDLRALLLESKADLEATIASMGNADDSSETEHKCNCKTPCVDCKCKSNKDTKTVLVVGEKATERLERQRILSKIQAEDMRIDLSRLKVTGVNSAGDIIGTAELTPEIAEALEQSDPQQRTFSLQSLLGEDLPTMPTDTEGWYISAYEAGDQIKQGIQQYVDGCEFNAPHVKFLGFRIVDDSTPPPIDATFETNTYPTKNLTSSEKTTAPPKDTKVPVDTDSWYISACARGEQISRSVAKIVHTSKINTARAKFPGFQLIKKVNGIPIETVLDPDLDDDPEIRECRDALAAIAKTFIGTMPESNPELTGDLRKMIANTFEPVEVKDDEMPDGSVHQTADDGKFHVPSQFAHEPNSPVHARYHAGMVVVFHRQGEQIAVIDFSDFACGPTAFQGAEADQIVEEICWAATGIAHQTVLGGLKAGDIRTVECEDPTLPDSVKSEKILTEEDITNIGKRARADGNQSPRIELPGIDVPMED